MELLRIIILSVGWPMLIIGGTFIMHQANKFSITNSRMALGRLVIILSLLILITMISLGVLATTFMIRDVEHGTLYTLPIFAVWCVVFCYLLYRAYGLSRQANSYLAHKKDIEHAKQDFLSIASHQLRTPLTTTKWTIEAALSDKTLSESAASNLKDLQSQNEDAIDLVNRLMTVLHMDTGTIHLNKEKFDAIPCLDKTTEELSVLARSKNLTFVTRHESESALIIADKTATKEICRNILQNAIKHGAPNGEVSISSSIKDKMFVVDVSNKGDTIKDEVMQNLFKKFNRTHRNNTDLVSEPGGLGLYVSGRFAKLQDGNISVQSTNNFTTFTITLPLAK